MTIHSDWQEFAFVGPAHPDHPKGGRVLVAVHPDVVVEDAPFLREKAAARLSELYGYRVSSVEVETVAV